MTFPTTRPRAGTVTSAVIATTFDYASPLGVSGLFRRVAMVIGDALSAAAIVICIPFVILAIGIPIALCVRLLLWIAGRIVGMF
jgi:type IV secretory pathway VirB3-like protein